MCIRDRRTKDNLSIKHVQKILDEDHFGLEKPKERIIEHIACLLYTSDAADERSSVDLGGRRIIKKQTTQITNERQHI